MRTWAKTISVLAVSLLIVCGAFSGVRYLTKGDIAQQQTQQIPQLVPKRTGCVNALVLGVDEEEKRTDTILAVSYDLEDQQIRILSVPRDTRVYFQNGYHKVNAAYAYGGAEQSKSVVTALTGIPFTYYMVFTTSAFRDIIDALGGVYFDVPRDMYYRDPVQNLTIDLKKGYQLLDGRRAEQLVRFRRYPEGDIARVHVQQEFFRALAEQKINGGMIKSLPKLYGAWSKNIKTDITVGDVMKYLSDAADLSAEHITMYDLPGAYNDTDYGTSYWICDKEKTKELVRTEFGYENGNRTTEE